MKQTCCDLAVIGGGPAGFFGAIHFAAANPDADVIILEKTDRVLQKVLISGGGRCNLTHECHDPRELIESYPRGGKSLLSAFYAFGPAQVLDWFRVRGLDFYTDEIGCVFPVTDNSQSVIDILLNEAHQLGVRVWQEAGVQELTHDGKNFVLALPNGNQLSAKRVLAASGGNRQALKVLRQFGVPVIEPVPSLFPIRLQETWLTEFAGLTMPECQISIPHTSLTGQGTILITHRGLSGPAVIRFSSWAARYLKESDYRTPVWVDWLSADGTQEQTLQTLKNWKQDHASKPVTQSAVFPAFASRLWQGFCDQIPGFSAKQWGDVSNAEISQFNQLLRQMELTMAARDAHKQEYVTCGGVDLRSVNLRSMQSKSISGLYFAGEVLDIDGLTGGYNLQNCWTTGWLAGTSLAEDGIDG